MRKKRKDDTAISIKPSGLLSKMGQLVAIDYNWGELDIYSHTRLDCCEETLAANASIDIDPEDVDLCDTATFVWEPA